jgi:hypothetical protein
MFSTIPADTPFLPLITCDPEFQNYPFSHGFRKISALFEALPQQETGSLCMG